MPTTIKFVTPLYDYWDRVLLIPCERIAARVIDIHSHPGWTEYDVRYFDSGEAKTTRVHEDELEVEAEESAHAEVKIDIKLAQYLPRLGDQPSGPWVAGLDRTPPARDGSRTQGRTSDPIFSDTLRGFAAFVRSDGFSMDDCELVAAKLDAAAAEIVAMMREGYTSDFSGNRAELRREALRLRKSAEIDHGYITMMPSEARKIADAIDAVIGK